MNDHEDAVRLRAYQIWERDGQPEGNHDSHWWQALAELGLANPSEQPLGTTALPPEPVAESPADRGAAEARDPT